MKAEIVPAPAPWVERMTAANKMLAEVADDPFRASRVWDFAEAARVYAIQVGLGVDAVNHAVAVKLKAQRLMADAVDKGQAEGKIATRQSARAAGSSPTPGVDSPTTLDDIGVTSQRVSEARKIRDAFSEEDIDTAAADASLAGEELSSAGMLARARGAIKNPGLYTSDTDEWYTPTEVIARVLKMWTTIDLDPCSNDSQNPNVPAAQHFTRDDDGLAQRWNGRVYMNPPYGREIAAWVDKLVDEHVAGHVTAAVALLPARTDTAWHLRLRDYPRCFVEGRLKFSGHDNSAPFPSMLVYLGAEVVDFVTTFSDVGDVFGRLSP